MRTLKRILATLALAATLALSSPAGQLHGQLMSEQQQHDYFNFWRQIFNAAWQDWGVPTIPFWP
jgi:hypothetical protein